MFMYHLAHHDYNYASLRPVFDDWLERYPGFFVGDNHTDPYVANFLATESRYLAESNVRFAFVELGRDNQSELFEAFNHFSKGADKALHDVLYERWSRYGDAGWQARWDMLLALREQGIQVIPIDHPRRNFSDSLSLHRDGWIGSMQPYLNKMAPDERYIVMGGALHGLSSHGMSSLLSIPMLQVPSQQSLTIRNAMVDSGFFSLRPQVTLAPDPFRSSPDDSQLPLLVMLHSHHPAALIRREVDLSYGEAKSVLEQLYNDLRLMEEHWQSSELDSASSIATMIQVDTSLEWLEQNMRRVNRLSDPWLFASLRQGVHLDFNDRYGYSFQDMKQACAEAESCRRRTGDDNVFLALLEDESVYRVPDAGVNEATLQTQNRE